MKSLKRTGGVILFVVLLAFTFFGCDNLSEPVDISEILGTLELDGKFASPTGSRISFSENKTITVIGYVRDENGEWSNTEHTGNLTIKNNKIVSDLITVNSVYYSDAEGYSNETESRKYEITINPEDPTTLLVTNTNKRLGGEYMEYTNTNVYIPVEKTRPNFDGTWDFGENKLIIKNGKYAIVDDSQVLYTGSAWYWTEVPNNLFFEYDISDTDYVEVDGYLARSGKFYIAIYSSEEGKYEYKTITKLSDSIDVDFGGENPLVGKYKDSYGSTIEITESSVTLLTNTRYYRDDETCFRVKNPSIDYTFSFMDFNSDWIDLGEKETTFEILKWNSENDEYDVIGTETYLVEYNLYLHGEHIEVSMEIDDKFYGFSAVKYKEGPVDFTGTWVLSEKIYDNEEFTDAQITINSDGTFSVFVDGKEIENSDKGVVDLETANSENCIAIRGLEAIITESGKLYADFIYKYDEEVGHWITAFFTKQ